MVEGWLNLPHVRKWWGVPEDALAYIKAPPPKEEGGQALICLRKEREFRPVGYLRWARRSREVLDEVGLAELPAGTVDLDIFIAEESALGKGVGPAALAQLVERLYREGAPLVGMVTSRENTRAGLRRLRKRGRQG